MIERVWKRTKSVPQYLLAWLKRSIWYGIRDSKIKQTKNILWRQYTELLVSYITDRNVRDKQEDAHTELGK